MEYLLGRLDYMNTLSETVAKYSGNSTDDPATTPVNPFITTTTTVAPDPGTEEECNWICSGEIQTAYHLQKYKRTLRVPSYMMHFFIIQ